MAQYAFKALSADGKPFTGTIEAASVDDAIARLGRQGHYPIAAEPARADPASAGPRRNGRPGRSRKGRARGRGRTRSSGPRLGRRDVLQLTRELAHMVASGIAVEQAVRTIARTTSAPAQRDAMDRIGEALRAGAPFSDALESYGPPFDAFYVSIIRAGEASGSLGGALRDLATSLKRADEFAGALRLATVYPAILLATTILSLTVILVFVVPQFEDMFARADAAPPFHTRMILGLSRFMVDYGWFAFAGLCLALVGALRLLRDKTVRARFHGTLLRLPVAGRLIAKAETARLCRSLGTMLANGVPVTQAFDRALPIISNRFVASRLEDVRLALRAGQGFAEPLSRAGVAPENAVQMIRVGEETGRLDTMLRDVAEMLEQDVQDALKQVLSVLEPVIIVTLGAIVGAIVLSIFLAIMASYDLAI